MLIVYYLLRKVHLYIWLHYTTWYVTPVTLINSRSTVCWGLGHNLHLNIYQDSTRFIKHNTCDNFTWCTVHKHCCSDKRITYKCIINPKSMEIEQQATIPVAINLYNERSRCLQKLNQNQHATKSRQQHYNKHYKLILTTKSQ